jgi:hypothetical protein
VLGLEGHEIEDIKRGSRRCGHRHECRGRGSGAKRQATDCAVNRHAFIVSRALSRGCAGSAGSLAVPRICSMRPLRASTVDGWRRTNVARELAALGHNVKQVQRPTIRFVPAKTDEQLDLQALHGCASQVIRIQAHAPVKKYS